MTHRTRAIVAILTIIALIAPAPLAHAGCGCSKPPPPLASVRPAFASAGAEISLFAPGITEGNQYQVTFRSMEGVENTISAIPVVRRDYADAVAKPQLVVGVPDGKPGPTAITVSLNGSVVLEVPESDFTRLQDPIQLTEDNGETISKCYRAAVGTDGTVYFPLDVSEIGKRTIFSGAAKGYRFTFKADDITIYNRQGILMQTLGPEEAGIFTIGDDEVSDGVIHTEVFTGDPRVASSEAFGSQPALDSSSTNGFVDFDPSPVEELYHSFDLFPDVGLVSGRPGIGTGLPASGAAEFAPLYAGDSAFGLLEASWAKLRSRGDRIGLSADVRLPARAAKATAAVGIHSNRGGVAVFGVRPDGQGGMAAVLESGWGPYWWPVLRADTKFTDNWLRLSVVFTYRGDDGGIDVDGVVYDIGPHGKSPGIAIAHLVGTFENPWLERNKKIYRGFGAVARSADPSNDVVRIDNFLDAAAHDTDDEIDVHPEGYPDGDSTNVDDPVDPVDDPTDDPADIPAIDPDDGPGLDPDYHDPGTDDPGSDDPTDPSDPVDGDDGTATDPTDGGGDTDPGDDGAAPGTDADDPDAAVDEAVRSFRLTYDRHEFLTYETMHAMNPDYFLDKSDSEWHSNNTRHIDHDHLIIAVRGLVEGTFPPPAGQTPPFNLHLTTMLADAPLSPGAPPRVLTNDCGGDTSEIPLPLCGPAPQDDCRPSAKARKSKLSMKDAKNGAGDALVWTWAKGEATDISEFGDPITTDSAALCMYDESGAVPALVFEGMAPAGATCGSDDAPCWRTVGKKKAATGYAYDDADRASDGIAEVLLKAGKDRKAKIIVKGKGENLSLPAMPLPLPLRVQLRTSNGGCWEATYSDTGAKRNSAKRFKARAD